MTNTAKPSRPFSLDAERAASRRVEASFNDAFAALVAFSEANPRASLGDGASFLVGRALTPRSKRS